ncbi:hypothetical protein SCHPADRAFT_817269 [Schizopora paradoxa]|uniref:T6SS Phospholipase effector Tle1-like catalytic domain-containing protein n=1 Tax=Schizopora paradoxa TaxID=27342 RepID=A0A0H2S722_9AGAM|nr:hypothetical protein SCHPADRAFT_817269 [Schizopora paradoxa]
MTVTNSTSGDTLVGSAGALGVGTLPNNPIPKSTKTWVPDPVKETGRARTLVLCFDGTGDQFDDDNSNIVKLMSCLKKDDQRQQMVYYQTGIGTTTKNSFISPLTIQFSKTLDEMFAWNLASHVQGGYEFLMQNYTAGDKISIFGFSRGAYTARALAGMLQKVGLLPASNLQQIPFAWAMYAREDADGLLNSEGFKKTFSIDVDIDFVGVWDTVCSVGLTNKELPFVGANSAIRVFRHALSLDERRVKFMPNFYHQYPSIEPEKAVGTVSSGIPALDTTIKLPDDGTSLPSPTTSKLKQNRPSGGKSESQKWQDKINAESRRKEGTLSIPPVLEVWFAGCHCDVGGGSVRNGTRHSLARIPLRWMIRQTFLANTGIIFDKELLKDVVGIDADTLYPVVQNRPKRIEPAPTMTLQEPEGQPWAIVTLLKFTGSLLLVPLEFIFKVVTWPIKHLWSLLRFSPPVKALHGLFPAKAPAAAPVVQATNASATPDEAFQSEEVEELRDALSPKYDQLALCWYWWILELIPMKFREQKGRRDDFFVRANNGQGRKIYGDAFTGGLMVHRSVKTRLAIKKGDKPEYQPKAWFKKYDKTLKKKVLGPATWDIPDDTKDPNAPFVFVD